LLLEFANSWGLVLCSGASSLREFFSVILLVKFGFLGIRFSAGMILLVEFDFLGNGFSAGVAKTHFEAAFGAGGVTAVKDNGFWSIQTNRASFLLIKPLLLLL